MSRPARSTSMAERVDAMLGEVNWTLYMKNTTLFGAASNSANKRKTENGNGKMARDGSRRRWTRRLNHKIVVQSSRQDEGLRKLGSHTLRE